MGYFKYSNNEKYDMLEEYIKARKNSAVAAAAYLDRYPERRQPNQRLFMKLAKYLKNYGSFVKPQRNVRRAQDPDIEETVLAYVYMDPSTSTRQLAAECGTSNRKAHAVLKRHKFHTYKLHVVQGLRPGDAEKRIEFCNWYVTQIRNNRNFGSQIMWTDETCFTNNGLFNRHNVHNWSQENPRLMQETNFQTRFSFNVWCGLLGSRLIGPIIYEGTLNSERYLNLLSHDLEQIIDNIPLAERRNWQWFQQDGAPPHNAITVRNYLNERFLQQWLGNIGPVRWPPRSPDLTPLDFFLWGYIKNLVYSKTYENVDELRLSVLRAFGSIRRTAIRKAVRHVEERVIRCRENNGLQFEHLI